MCVSDMVSDIIWSGDETTPALRAPICKHLPTSALMARHVPCPPHITAAKTCNLPAQVILSPALADFTYSHAIFSLSTLCSTSICSSKKQNRTNKHQCIEHSCLHAHEQGAALRAELYVQPCSTCSKTYANLQLKTTSNHIGCSHAPPACSILTSFTKITSLQDLPSWQTGR